MDIENVQSEVERLSKDKTQIEVTIVNLEKELVRLKSQSDMLSGALQTCNYFLSQFEDDSTEEKSKDNV
jgi:predicted  nucleic acid-binding Zn-ribbon protein